MLLSFVNLHCQCIYIQIRWSLSPAKSCFYFGGLMCLKELVWKVESLLINGQNSALWLWEMHVSCVGFPHGYSALTSVLFVPSLQSDGLKGHPCRGLHHCFLWIVQQMAEVPTLNPMINAFLWLCCCGDNIAPQNSFCGYEKNWHRREHETARMVVQGGVTPQCLPCTTWSKMASQSCVSLQSLRDFFILFAASSTLATRCRPVLLRETTRSRPVSSWKVFSSAPCTSLFPCCRDSWGEDGWKDQSQPQHTSIYVHSPPKRIK